MSKTLYLTHVYYVLMYLLLSNSIFYRYLQNKLTEREGFEFVLDNVSFLKHFTVTLFLNLSHYISVIILKKVSNVSKSQVFLAFIHLTIVA